MSHWSYSSNISKASCRSSASAYCLGVRQRLVHASCASAPLSRSNRRAFTGVSRGMFVSLFRDGAAAKLSADLPFLFTAFMSARRSSRAFMTAGQSSSAAFISGVQPSYFSSGSTPCISCCCTANSSQRSAAAQIFGLARLGALSLPPGGERRASRFLRRPCGGVLWQLCRLLWRRCGFLWQPCGLGALSLPLGGERRPSRCFPLGERERLGDERLPQAFLQVLPAFCESRECAAD